MSSDGHTSERRQFARRQVHGQMAIVPARVSVRVLDISRGGVLLHSNDASDPGVRGRLRLVLEGMFSAEVEVRRVMAHASGGYRIGAMFLAPLLLEQLIERVIPG